MFITTHPSISLASSDAEACSPPPPSRPSESTSLPPEVGWWESGNRSVPPPTWRWHGDLHPSAAGLASRMRKVRDHGS